MSVITEGITEFEVIVNNMAKTRQRLEARSATKSDIYFWQALQDYYNNALQAAREGKPLILSGMFPPHELFTAMDIPYYVAENHAIMTGQSGADVTISLMEKGESYGMSADVCSPHRVAIGVARSGMAPRPTMVVSTSTTCDQTLKLYELLADFYSVPNYMVDSTFRLDKASIDYGKKDIQELIGFLEVQTGKKLDMDKLKQVLRLSRESYDYWEKICDLRKAVPCPAGGRSGIKDLTVIQIACGTELGVKYFQARYQELKEKVDKGEGAISPEKHRIAWLYVLPLFDLKIADWLEEEFGAVIAVDSFGYATTGIELNPDDPLEFLVKKPLKRGFVCKGYGANEDTHFVDELARVTEEYHADVAILLSHWSCQQYCGVIRLLRDAIGGKLGLPFFILNGDLMDPRVASSEQMKAELTEFFTTSVPNSKR
ncbi:MAG: Benzoyl-CoA reductase/2-hydroxyglutaryl-CoA dehydratase subunit, BcrC/BadD/HgdB [Dehalococcoidia bacterium]|nr:Benzoyl-CoA reductase/2-hydroxyglutaryl-CoA dehydratase subunit, BcrC/BadD/HgdB [Dehalococcoidia bacterium]